MRGTRLSAFCAGRRSRFIPAHAGNTGPKRKPASATSVHPRACGEHPAGGLSGDHISGSSPRMRGTPAGAPCPCGRVRFIPAHAGNTLTAAIISTSVPVHPRACGEHGQRPARHRQGSGSSPRMRGTLGGQRALGIGQRFIPAHAGNTAGPVSWSEPSPVHPRACGEHQLERFQMFPQVGSSPRMRGTLVEHAKRRVGHRFIPAHAGNTPATFCHGREKPVHPRACGEH